MVIMRTIYTKEEADRREAEEKEMMKSLESVEDRIRDWCTTDVS